MPSDPRGHKNKSHIKKPAGRAEITKSLEVAS